MRGFPEIPPPDSVLAMLPSTCVDDAVVGGSGVEFLQPCRKHTEFEHAQCGTIRLKLLKIGAQVRVSIRRVLISMASGYPYVHLFAEVYKKLRSLKPVPT